MRWVRRMSSAPSLKKVRVSDEGMHQRVGAWARSESLNRITRGELDGIDEAISGLAMP